MNVSEIQSALRQEGLDGWLFFDHHQRDPLAYRVLQFEPERMCTRRWYYFIPASGEPRKLVHQIEAGMLDAIPGEKLKYSGWGAQLDGIKAITAGAKKIAMQYSANCAIPYVAMVDAGTIELIRGLGLEIVTSANLVQQFEAKWNQEKLDSHLENSDCEAFMAEMKLRADEKTFYYPDVFVACDKVKKSKFYREEPILIIEVISPSTRQTDRREKLRIYQQIPSVQEYVIIEQEKIHIELHRRQSDGRWITYFYNESDMDEIIELQSVDLKLTLDEIYRRVKFE